MKYGQQDRQSSNVEDRRDPLVDLLGGLLSQQLQGQYQPSPFDFQAADTLGLSPPMMPPLRNDQARLPQGVAATNSPVSFPGAVRENPTGPMTGTTWVDKAKPVPMPQSPVPMQPTQSPPMSPIPENSPFPPSPNPQSFPPQMFMQLLMPSLGM